MFLLCLRASRSVFAKHVTEEVIKVERAVVEALPQRIKKKNKFYSLGAHFLIADARTIFCSQNNKLYGCNRIDALL